MFPILVLCFLACEAIVHRPTVKEWSLNFTYHDHEELTDTLLSIAYFYPDLASLYTIGNSVKMKELWVLRITSPKSAVLGTPNVRFVGNIHGNEPVGRELILHLAQYLVTNYETDEEVQWLLDRTVIHLLPSMNPDGFEIAREGDCNSVVGRGNENTVDLNRSFPDYFRENRVAVQPETEAVIRWTEKIPFVVSASFHGGNLVASFPYENDAETGARGLRPKYITSPDDDTYRYLAGTYANNNLRMHRSGCEDGSVTFPGGITNGGAWYKITGGLQDYSYIWHGSMELTLEVSCCKYPPSSFLPMLWNENRRAILELAKRAHVGVRGLVLDSVNGHRIEFAVLHVVGRNINFTSAESGEFWRVLLPGDYVLKVHATGYREQAFPFTVRPFNESFPEATWLHVYLNPVNVTVSACGFRNASLLLIVFLVGMTLQSSGKNKNFWQLGERELAVCSAVRELPPRSLSREWTDMSDEVNPAARAFQAAQSPDLSAPSPRAFRTFAFATNRETFTIRLE